MWGKKRERETNVAYWRLSTTGKDHNDDPEFHKEEKHHIMLKISVHYTE